MSLKKAMIIDISIFSVLAIILDVILGVADIFYINFFMAASYSLIILCYYRWNYYGIIPNVAIIITHLFIYFKGNDYKVLIAHSISLLVFLLIPLIKKLIKRELERKSFLEVIGLSVPIYILLIGVESLLNLMFNNVLDLTSIVVYYSLNLIILVILLVIISYQQNLLVDMNMYLVKVSKEKDSGK
jgi:hypothetical protein